MKERITIEITNTDIVKSLFAHVTSDRYFIFYYDNNSTVKDLYIFLIDEMGIAFEGIEESLELRFCIEEDNTRRFFRLDYSLQAFIHERISGDGILRLQYTIGIPGGMGARLFEIANIRINPEEKKHKNIPHVHISPYLKQLPVVRIELKSLTQMKTDKVSIEHVFDKKKLKEIIYFLETNREALIDYYYRVQKGEYIPHFPLAFHNQIIDFK